MVYLDKDRPIAIINWDWKADPSGYDLDYAVSHIADFNDLPSFFNITTNDDENALLVLGRDYIETQANEFTAQQFYLKIKNQQENEESI